MAAGDHALDRFDEPSATSRGLNFADLIEALPPLGPFRLISHSGPAVVESIVALVPMSLADGTWTSQSSAHQWHVDASRPCFARTHDTMHARSGRRVLFVTLHERADCPRFARLHLPRETHQPFESAREREFARLHADVARPRARIGSRMTVHRVGAIAFWIALGAGASAGAESGAAVRMASLVPCVTEALSRLDAPSPLIATVRTAPCAPPFRPLLALGNPHAANLEMLVAANPMLIVADFQLHTVLVDRLRDLFAEVQSIDTSTGESALDEVGAPQRVLDPSALREVFEIEARLSHEARVPSRRVLGLAREVELGSRVGR